MIDVNTIKSFVMDNPTVLRLNCEQEMDILQFIPDDKFKDKDFAEIINIVYSTYKNIRERFAFNNSCLEQFKMQPMFYEILFNGGTITFNFAVTKRESEYVKNRLQGVFHNSTIVYINDYINDFLGGYMYHYKYEKDSICSLDTSRDKNVITNILALKKDIKDTDKMLIQVSMLPVASHWKNTFEEKINKLRKGVDTTTSINPVVKFFDWLLKVSDGAMDIMDDVVGVPIEKRTQPQLEKDLGKKLYDNLSSDSRQKAKYDGFKTEIKTYVKTNDSLSAYSLAKGVETAYKDIAKDNSIVMEKKNDRVCKAKDLKREQSMFNKMIMSTQELSQIVRFPEGVIQRRFKMPSVKMNQVSAPKEMRKGKILIGHLTKHGETVGVFMSENRDLTCLPLFLITKMGGGKTTFILNVCNDAIKAGHGLVLFDYIKNCATGNALLNMYPDCKKITFDKWEDLNTFAFPEVEILDTDSPYERRIKANILAKEVKYLLNSMASDSQQMTRIMSEYLTAACKVVFIHKGMTLQRVYEVLTDDETREEFINKSIECGVFTSKSFEVKKLEELDDNESAKSVNGLLDRFSIINEDTLFQEMMMKPYENNVNFVDIMNNSEPVVILMPQDIFTSKLHKDVICTYFMSRIRLAMSRRTNFDQIAHIVVDEIHQIPQTMNLISDTIAEPRKFSMQYIMSMHSLSQIENKKVREQIMGVGCNFMLLKGISKQAFDEFAPMLNEEYEFEDIINMDYRFGSLNMFMVDNSYSNFITELPEPLTDSDGKFYIA